jgi:hypothetical protein
MEHEGGVRTCVAFFAREENSVPDGIHVAEVVRYELERHTPERVVDRYALRYAATGVEMQRVTFGTPWLAMSAIVAISVSAVDGLISAEKLT